MRAMERCSVAALVCAGLMGVTGLRAESRHLWLLTATNVPGVAETATPETVYGVQVFVGAVGGRVTGWRIALTVTLADGTEVEYEQVLARNVKGAASGVPYSDVAVFWIGPEAGFRVTGLVVDDIAGLGI